MDQPAELLGESARMQLVRDKVRRLIERQRAGQRPPPILIQGDTGTGKGLVARVLHREGARARGPFVDVNCAAIPETLLEAELFGFERGAFTDAYRAKAGLFQAAHGGVLFLDEVGLLAQTLQAKLLTVIEERAVRRLGSTRPEPADVWLISATNTDLKAGVSARRFREDLYHRLAVVTIDLPPLRHRGRDILVLAERFLARTCADYGLPPKRLEPATQARLLAHSWPGNVRELANVIERAALFADADLITPDALSLLPTEDAGPRVSAAQSLTATGRDELVHQRLLAALEQTGWNISHTAARLGIARNTVYARLEKFGLRPDLPGKSASDRRRRDEPFALSPVPEMGVRWERRSITLLRADVSGSHGVDAWSQASRALEAVIAKVNSFGGRVEDMTPTSLVAAFGLDTADDPPRCAANAAMAIQKSARRAQQSDGPAPTVMIGLHVAPLLIGRVGAGTQIDGGDKRAQWPLLERLLQKGEPGETLASVAAEPFLERRFELTRLSPGPEGHELAYRLTGRERRGLALWGAMTRFVGRRDELEVLQKQLPIAASGHGQLVAIGGEAGVGKSRLVFELSHSDRVQGWRVLETGSVSGGKALGYLPVADLLRGYFGIGDRDTHDEIRDAVLGKLVTLDPTLERTAPALLALLDVPSDDPRWQRLDPSQRRHQTFEAVKRLVRRESEVQPLLVIFEDVQWIDTETEALLDALVAGLPTMPVLLVVTHRPEYQHAWSGRTYYTQLRLDPLPVETANEFLGALVGRDDSIEPLKRLLADKTGRNPLFLEESVRSLVETRAVRGWRGGYHLAEPVETIEVPPTVQAILASRIDRLPLDDKQLLETAAVIGKDVPFALLQALTDDGEATLRQRLGRLQMAEFLYESRVFPDPEYTFKHALTHEVAYGSVVPARRLALHARIASAIEQLYASRLVEHIERLAHHRVKAELWESAVHHLRRAAAKAVKRHALREALAWFDQALSALSHLPESRATLEQAVDIRLERMPAVLQLGEYRLAHDYLRDLEHLGEQLGDERRVGYVYRLKQNIHNHLGQLDEALACGRRVLDIAQRLGELPLRIVATTILEQTYFMRGDYQRVIDLAYPNLRALPAEEERCGGAVPISVYDRGWLVRSLAEMGRFAEAAEPATTAREIAERLQDPYAIAWACYCAGNLHTWMGRWESARSEYDLASDVLRAAGMATTLANIMAASSWVHGRLGASVEALRRAREAETLLDVARAQARTAGNSWSYFWLCRTYVLLGRFEDAERLRQRILEPPNAASEAHASYVQGEIAADPQRSQNETGEECYRQALTLADGLGMRPLIAHCHIGLAGVYGRTARFDKAQEQLAIATTMCRELGMQRWLQRAEAGSLNS